MAGANPALYVWLVGQHEREKGHPNPAGSPMGIPIRWEPGNRGKTPDRAVGSPGHLGHLTPSSQHLSQKAPGSSPRYWALLFLVRHPAALRPVEHGVVLGAVEWGVLCVLLRLQLLGD